MSNPLRYGLLQSISCPPGNRICKTHGPRSFQAKHFDATRTKKAAEETCPPFWPLGLKGSTGTGWVNYEQLTASLLILRGSGGGNSETEGWLYGVILMLL
ncbi:MAG: hypothetical protein NZM04_06470 [Methylacidiphilales bacterium]|nr:hypothetical protein [Candidatus Methylacidiphilales bacterium]